MIVVLGALVALGPLTIDMYLPALPKIADELSVSSSVVQLTLTGTLAGLALGQLIVGPLSDSLGRRRPLMAGIVLHMLASVLCVLAPNIAVLGVARVLQGMGAAAAMVVAIAVVGDLFAESAAATVLSRLMLVLGVAPVVAPSLGAAVLLQASWHWVFAALVVLAGALLLVAALALPETLPAVASAAAAGARHRRHLCRTAARRAVRHPGAGRRAGHVGSVRLHRGRVVRPAGPLRARPAGLRVGVRRGRGRVDRRDAVQRRAAEAVLAAGDRAVGAGQRRCWPAVVFVGLSVAHVGGLAGFVVPVWAILAAMGLVIPNAPAVALSRHPDAAGTAAALLGAAQFGLGAAVAPLVGVLGNDELALAVVMTSGVVIALLALLAVGASGGRGRRRRRRDDAMAEPA